MIKFKLERQPRKKPLVLPGQPVNAFSLPLVNDSIPVAVEEPSDNVPVASVDTDDVDSLKKERREGVNGLSRKKVSTGRDRLLASLPTNKFVTLKIYNDHVTFQSQDFLKCIERLIIPNVLLTILNDIDFPFIDGCLPLRIIDCRMILTQRSGHNPSKTNASSGAASTTAVNSSASPTANSSSGSREKHSAVSKRVLLRPAADSILYDLKYIWEKVGGAFGYGSANHELFDEDFMLQQTTEKSLCLKPDFETFRQINSNYFCHSTIMSSKYDLLTDKRKRKRRIEEFGVEDKSPSPASYNNGNAEMFSLFKSKADLFNDKNYYASSATPNSSASRTCWINNPPNVAGANQRFRFKRSYLVEEYRKRKGMLDAEAYSGLDAKRAKKCSELMNSYLPDNRKVIRTIRYETEKADGSHTYSTFHIFACTSSANVNRTSPLSTAANMKVSANTNAATTTFEGLVRIGITPDTCVKGHGFKFPIPDLNLVESHVSNFKYLCLLFDSKAKCTADLSMINSLFNSNSNNNVNNGNNGVYNSPMSLSAGNNNNAGLKSTASSSSMIDPNTSSTLNNNNNMTTSGSIPLTASPPTSFSPNYNNSSSSAVNATTNNTSNNSANYNLINHPHLQHLGGISVSRSGSPVPLSSASAAVAAAASVNRSNSTRPNMMILKNNSNAAAAASSNNNNNFNFYTASPPTSASTTSASIGIKNTTTTANTNSTNLLAQQQQQIMNQQIINQQQQQQLINQQRAVSVVGSLNMNQISANQNITISSNSGNSGNPNNSANLLASLLGVSVPTSTNTNNNVGSHVQSQSQSLSQGQSTQIQAQLLNRMNSKGSSSNNNNLYNNNNNNQADDILNSLLSNNQSNNVNNVNTLNSHATSGGDLLDSLLYNAQGQNVVQNSNNSNNGSSSMSASANSASNANNVDSILAALLGYPEQGNANANANNVQNSNIQMSNQLNLLLGHQQQQQHSSSSSSQKKQQHPH